MSFWIRQMQTLCSHSKKVRLSHQMDPLSFFEFSRSRTLNCLHSPCQENCTTFLLVSWEEETHNLVSVVITKKEKSLLSFCSV